MAWPKGPGECPSLEVFQWTLLSLWIGCLGFASGYGFSSRRVAINGGYIVSILVSIVIIFLLCASFGRRLGETVPLRLIEVLLAFAMMGIGFFLLYFPPRFPGKRDLVFMTVAWFGAMIVQGFMVGINGGQGGLLAVWFSLLLAGGAMAGGILSQFHHSHWRLHQLKPYVAGLIFIVLGLMRTF